MPPPSFWNKSSSFGSQGCRSWDLPAIFGECCRVCKLEIDLVPRGLLNQEFSQKKCKSFELNPLKSWKMLSFSRFVDQVRELLTLQTFAHFSHALLLQEQKVAKLHLNNLLAQATQPPGTLSVASTIVSQAVNDHVIQQLWYFMGVERDVVCTNCGIRKRWVRTSSDWVKQILSCTSIGCRPSYPQARSLIQQTSW